MDPARNPRKESWKHSILNSDNNNNNNNYDNSNSNSKSWTGSLQKNGKGKMTARGETSRKFHRVGHQTIHGRDPFDHVIHPANGGSSSLLLPLPPFLSLPSSPSSARKKERKKPEQGTKEKHQTEL